MNAASQRLMRLRDVRSVRAPVAWKEEDEFKAEDRPVERVRVPRLPNSVNAMIAVKATLARVPRRLPMSRMTVITGPAIASQDAPTEAESADAAERGPEPLGGRVNILSTRAISAMTVVMTAAKAMLARVPRLPMSRILATAGDYASALAGSTDAAQWGAESLRGRISAINARIAANGIAAKLMAVKATLAGVSRRLPHRLQMSRILAATPYSGHARIGSPDAARCGTEPLGGRVKRVMDVFVAGLALVLLAPIMPILMLLIKLSSEGPVFYAHPRVGFGGRTFNCYKFRTMRVDGDRVLAEHLAANPEAAIEWREKQKLDNDPRVTPLGQLLRKSSLDEVPQLINVLRGEMSCIGPRPVVVAELSRYGVHGMDYIRSRPGLTGIWQVSGRSNRSYEDRVLLDHYYHRNWSVWLDVIILVKTVPCVLRFNETA